ncbi:MAG: heterodisulfide reductase subunit [Chloroflexi bacterium CG_4_10_14_0_8_um_filter_46_9]|nr:MAG: hypothetical protein AUK39_00695 [Dehalococcoidia bacterium CG2_30_46_19]PIW39892.1 MAG: heterodisulfide reductase subunit [Chloroflexi bacterium CG15_BIG_FIL_POST_REV_8_21_14_020_46_15]PIZ26555.1 MAG: heterodisulfide reductase subunit [Chloroflexi bacterium CG_4_10_14_0_8_um_filter_46_9]
MKLEQLGIERDRVRLEWVSASEGTRFAEVVTDLTQTIKKVGPGPFNKQQQKLTKESGDD